jgi:hypothetical protein
VSLILFQTKELSLEKVTEFAGVTRTFRHEVRPWVEAITNIELLPVVDIRGAKYGFTGKLINQLHSDFLVTFGNHFLISLNFSENFENFGNFFKIGKVFSFAVLNISILEKNSSL